MKTKKLLAMLLAIAMITALVPGLAITAGAASSTTVINTIEGATVIWSAPDNSLVGTDNDGNAPVASNWSGWSTSVNAGYANLRSYNEGITLQFYSPVNTDLNATVSAPAAAQAKGAEKVIIEWKHKGQVGPGAGGTCYYDFSFKDSNGKEIAFLKLDKNHTVADETNSDGYYAMGYPEIGTDMAIVAYNNADGATHTVEYYVDGKKVATNNSAADVINGFGAIQGLGGYWDNYEHIGFIDLTIGAVMPESYVAPISVISGNEPILPKTVSIRGTETPVTWENADFTTGSDVKTFELKGTAGGTDVSTTIVVYPMTFAMPDQESYNGQPGNVVYLPVSLSQEFSMEFDLTVNAIRDSSVQIGADGKIFGAGQIGLGTNGSFSPTGGDGKGNNSNLPSITTVAAGETYRIFMTANAYTDEYNLTLTKADGSTYESGTRHFRTDSDYINTITMLTNGSGANGDLKISNVKFYAPEAASSIQNYTVKFSGVKADEYTVTTTESTDLGYNGEKIFPNLVIPYKEGYVFKKKEVNTSDKTITLTYEATKPERFFDNVANDTPFISLNMLGAHDAFTAEITNKMDAAGSQQGDTGSQTVTKADGGTGASASKAQEKDALGLLDSGVRYFDIRLSRSSSDFVIETGIIFKTKHTAPHTNSVFYTTHGFLSGEFAPIMVTVAQWAKEHPGEIIVLDFQEAWDNVNSDGNSTPDTWRAIDSLLTTTGINDFVTLNKDSDLAAQTYGGLTNNGTKANIVLFGRDKATLSSIGKFILRGYSSAESFAGKLYSNYEPSSGTKIQSSFSAGYINNQIDKMSKRDGNHPIVDMFRVMQAQSESILTSLVNQATTDNNNLYSALSGTSYPNWLSSLPVVMVNNAGSNTDDIVRLLKSCNEAQDITVNYKGTIEQSETKQLMVGTLYTEGHELFKGGDYGYYVVTDTPTSAGSAVIPVPYNGSIDLTVAALPSNVYTIQKDERKTVGRTLAYYEGGTLDTNFSAYNWGAVGAASDNRRVGVAILEVERGHNSYTLDATRLRDYTTGTNNVNFYAISYEDYQKLDISDFTAVTANFTDENKVAFYTNSVNADNTDATPVSISLDAEKMNRIIGESGKVVIFGDSHGGLYRLRGNDIKIVGKTVDVASVTPALGWDGKNFTVDFLFGEGVTGTYTVEVFNGTTSIGEKDITVNDDIKGIAVAPVHTNAIYTAKVTDSNGYVGVNASDPASVYSLVAKALKNFDAPIKSDQKDAALKVLNDGGFYLIKENSAWKLNDEAALIMELKGDEITLNENVVKAGLTFGDKMAVEASDGTSLSVEVNGASAKIVGLNGIGLEAAVIYLEDIEFVLEDIAESAADEAVSGELSFVEEV
ncbi:MAG: hypothetical protein J1F63_00785 [Oscillospiraceae bacterium]|nr:hypothetical protein [Oscillospiraceae bacterium]